MILPIPTFLQRFGGGGGRGGLFGAHIQKCGYFWLLAQEIFPVRAQGTIWDVKDGTGLAVYKFSLLYNYSGLFFYKILTGTVNQQCTTNG